MHVYMVLINNFIILFSLDYPKMSPESVAGRNPFLVPPFRESRPSKLAIFFLIAKRAGLAKEISPNHPTLSPVYAYL